MIDDGDVLSDAEAVKPEPESKAANRYTRIISHIFFEQYNKGLRNFTFPRSDFERVAHLLKIKPVKNFGDNIYNFRFGRGDLPEEIMKTAPKKKGWMIWLAGRGVYRFKLGQYPFFIPNSQLAATKIPDATPGIIEMYALTDEQALLAKLRYNRLIDIFTGVTCYSLQSHLRTTVPNMGQIETDEVYVGIDRRGAHYIFPLQAKGGKDRISIVQIEQDLGLCRKKSFATMTALPIAAHFNKRENVIALFAFEKQAEEYKVLMEKHYQLVHHSQMTAEELDAYRRRLAEEGRPFDVAQRKGGKKSALRSR